MQGEPPQVATRKASQRIPMMALVDDDLRHSVANIPRGAWEPVSYLESEMEEAVNRVNAMQVPGCTYINSCQPSEEAEDGGAKQHLAHCLEWVRQSTLKDWSQVSAWLSFVLTNSQSVDALRSWQLVGGLQSQNQQARPSGQVVMPDFPQPAPPGPKPKRSILSRSN